MVSDAKPDSRDRIIDVASLEPRFRNEIVAEPGGERFMQCFSCGTCVAGCPVAGRTTKYNPRRIIRMALLGMRQEVLTSEFVWLCSACYTCHERCPQDVHIPEVMNAIRNIAVREGHVPTAFRQQAQLLGDHGRLYEITSFENERRTEWGLPPIQEQADAVRRILIQAGVLEEAET